MAKEKTRRRRQKAEPIVIPSEPEDPVREPEDFNMLVYGPPKIGKSSLAAEANDPLFLTTDPGLKHIRTRKVQVKSWEHFRRIVEELETGKHSAGCIVVDTFDDVFRFCSRFICEREGIDYPGDEGMGKGWDMIFNELLQWVMRLQNLGVGCIFISHQRDVEIERRHLKFTKHMTSLPATARRVLLPRVDFILMIGYEEKVIRGKRTPEDTIGDERLIYMRPSPYTEVGSWAFSNMDDVPESVAYGWANLQEVFGAMLGEKQSKPKQRRRKR